MARKGMVVQSVEGEGKVRQVKARQDNARQGKA
jgi:hypothetical protein